MALTALGGTPLLAVGMPARQNYLGTVSSLTNLTLNAANLSAQMIGHLFWEDGGTHTVDTSGSSSIGWRAGGVTFANGSTVVKVGLAALDTSNGPPGRAVHSSNVVTFDVSASFTGGGGGITGLAWQESVPTSGSKSIAHSDLVVVGIQMIARGGSDSVAVQMASAVASGVQGHPTVTAWTGTSYSPQQMLPNVVVRASDGTRGYIYGGYLASAVNGTAWNNTSGTKEYGNLIQLPFPAKAYGLVFNANLGNDTDAILYSDPLGTPVAEKTISIDFNTVGDSGQLIYIKLFPAPYSMAANTPYAAILKPTTSTNLQFNYKTFGNAAHQAAESGGGNGYAINRNTGAFAAQNSNLDRYPIGILVGAFDDATGGGTTVNVLGVIGS